MPRKATKILRANSESIVLETTIGTDYRLSIPKSLRHWIKPTEKMQITFQRAEPWVGRNCLECGKPLTMEDCMHNQGWHCKECLEREIKEAMTK